MNLVPDSIPEDEIHLLDLPIVLAKHKKNDLERDVCYCPANFRLVEQCESI